MRGKGDSVRSRLRHLLMLNAAQELLETRVKADVSLLPSGNYFVRRSLIPRNLTVTPQFMGNIVVLLIAVIAIILGLLIINRTR